MTLSGLLYANANREISPKVLIPLLVDDPLRVIMSQINDLAKRSLNPSFSG